MATVENIEKIVIAYRLDLSQEEAKTLSHILSKVGGDSQYTARRYSSQISVALADAGIDWRNAAHGTWSGSIIAGQI